MNEGEIMKKTKTFQEHVEEIKRTKEELPLHKMDDFSRRNFIQSVGTFLAGLTIPSIIRLETMSSLSKKIFGDSMAFAQTGGFGREILFLINIRSGFQSTSVVSMYGHDGAVPIDINMPWTTGITSWTTSGMPVILPPNAQGLVPFVGGIQHIMGKSRSGHTEYLQSTQRAGMGELTALRAATEDKAGYKPLISSPFLFGNAGLAATQDLPSTLVPYTPVTFGSIASAYNLFSPIALTTNQGNSLTNSLRTSLLGIISSKFEKDVTKGVLQKDKDLIQTNSDQTVKILKSNFSAGLNPANEPDVMDDLSAGLVSMGRLSMGGIDPAEAMYVGIKQAILGVGPTVVAMNISSGDWHGTNNLAAGDGAGDEREVAGRYLAKLFENVLTLAQAGTWESLAGQSSIVTAMVSSEFGRTILLGGQANDDNGDGQSDFSLTLTSDTSPNFLPGCFGGTNATGQEVGFNPTSLAHAASIAYPEPDTMFGHKLKLARINRELFNLEDYTGFSNDDLA